MAKRLKVLASGNNEGLKAVALDLAGSGGAIRYRLVWSFR
jgi:hypothetical protein